MARKTGDRNRDFDKKREQILDALQGRLLSEDAPRITMHEMATVAGCSLSTLRHHFGSRPNLYAALLARYGGIGKRYHDELRKPVELPLKESLTEFLRLLLIGLRHGVLDIHAVGLAVGMRDEVVGPAYLREILEPMLQAVEHRLAHHRQRGELRDVNLRIAALSLVSPLLMAALHQQGLFGHEVRPLSLDDLSAELLQSFLRAHATPAG
jgi:AcrR family transcriptional regulator